MPISLQKYSGFGLRFHYPLDWELSEEITQEQVSITVSSAETAFWSVTVLRHCPDPESVLRAALLAYEEEYDEMDFVETEAALATRQAPAVEVHFVCLELTNTAFLQALRVSQFTLLVLYQLNDGELQEQEPVLEQINSSLTIAPDQVTEISSRRK